MSAKQAGTGTADGRRWPKPGEKPEDWKVAEAESKPASNHPIEMYGKLTPRAIALAIDWGAMVVLGWIFAPLSLVYLGAVVAGVALRGQSPGKKVMGLYAVDPHGHHPGWRRGILREVVGRVASTVPLFIGYLGVFHDPWRRCWHDRIADTYVLREGAQSDLGR